MRMNDTAEIHVGLASVSPAHADERECDDPVRSAHFDGVPSISVAK